MFLRFGLHMKFGLCLWSALYLSLQLNVSWWLLWYMRLHLSWGPTVSLWWRLHLWWETWLCWLWTWSIYWKWSCETVLCTLCPWWWLLKRSSDGWCLKYVLTFQHVLCTIGNYIEPSFTQHVATVPSRYHNYSIDNVVFLHLGEYGTSTWVFSTVVILGLGIFYPLSGRHHPSLYIGVSFHLV